MSKHFRALAVCRGVLLPLAVTLSVTALFGAPQGTLTRAAGGPDTPVSAVKSTSLSVAEIDFQSEALDSLIASGEIKKTYDYARSQLESLEETFGKDDPRVADGLLLTARALMELDRLEEALEQIEKAIKFADNTEKESGAVLSVLLDTKARIFNEFGRYKEALPLLNRSLYLKRDLFGPTHSETAFTLATIAKSYLGIGEFAVSRDYFARALEILDRDLGPGHPRTAEAACGLGLCLTYLNDYSEAEIVARKHLDSLTSRYGDRSGTAARLMLNLGEILAMTGKHEESTALYRRAAEIIQDIYGPDHTLTAAALAGLGHIRRRMSLNEEAAELYSRAIEIVERRHGLHPDLVYYRGRLGMCFEPLERNEDGVKSIETSIEEAERMYGPGSYHSALEMRHLGFLLQALRRYEESYSTLKESLTLLERYFGPDHPFLSKCLKGLAAACRDLGYFEEGYSYIRRAVSIHESAERTDRTELTFLLRNKGNFEMILRNWDAALATSFKEAEMCLSEFESIYHIITPAEALTFSLGLRYCSRSMLTSTVETNDLPYSKLKDIFSFIALTQGQVLDHLASQQRYLDLLPDTSSAASLRDDLRREVEKISSLVVRGPGADSGAYRRELQDAWRQKEITERSIAARSEKTRIELHHTRRSDRFSLEELTETMPENSTLVHFCCFPKCTNPKDSGAIQVKAHYGAFTLERTKTASYELGFVDLGDAAVIDSLIFQWRRSIDVIEPGRWPTAREEAEYRIIASRLYEKIWWPVTENIHRSDISEVEGDSSPLVFIVPDLWLHLLDFNTLLSPDMEPVIEQWKVHYLSSARDLIRSNGDRHKGKGMLAVGNPDYGSRVNESGGGGDSGERGVSKAFLSEIGEGFEPLPGAEEETESIARLFELSTGEKAAILTGKRATETAVKKRLAGKRYAHIASHGFFCEDLITDRITFLKTAVNSLIMSGLLLADGETDDDGLLTAFEISSLDLSCLDWFVLSACGSGLGSVHVGEGMFGLRRALEIAGVRTVVVALWRIDDSATKDLMEEIYENRFNGQTTVDAIRNAQLEKARFCLEVRGRFHPALWGGIIAEGDWR